MLKNYLKTAIRNLKKQGTHSIINIAGLSVGMAIFILILSYVWHELSFDRFHPKVDQIYRVVQTYTHGDKEYHVACTGSQLAQALSDEFPEILYVTRLGLVGDLDLHYKSNFEIKKKSDEYLRVDPSIFDVFDINLINGDPGTALNDPNSIILTEELGMELYGDEDPMGKIITITLADTRQAVFQNPNKEYIVTGIAKAMPGNSRITFNFLIPYGKDRSGWYSAQHVDTYIVLPEDYPPERLEEKFHGIIRKYFGPSIEKKNDISYDEWVESGGICRLNLQPLKDIYMDSYYTGEWVRSSDGNRTNVYIFSVIAFFILLLACINFMIMSTSRSANRAKEVGIRKIAGSSRGQLIQQFLTESILLSILALVLSLLLVKLLLPTFIELVGTQLSIALTSAGFILLTLMAIALIVGILAGSYPAFFLSAFQPITVLKGGIQERTKGLSLRNALIVFQYVISISLIVASLVVYNQLFFMRDYDPGFSKENNVLIHNGWKMSLNTKEQKEKEEGYEIDGYLWTCLILQTLRQELLKHSHVLSASVSQKVPGRGSNYELQCRPEGANANEKYLINWIGVDPDYIETFGIKLIAGRNYSTFMPVHLQAPDSPEGIVINETAVEYFGWTEPLGKYFIYEWWGPEDGKINSTWSWHDINAEVIGVIKDYHFQSLYTEIKPLVLLPDEGYNISVKIQPNDIPATLEFLEKTWNTFAPDVPFVYSFLEDDLDKLYGKEERLGKIFLYFTILAIVIACVGLFGLAAFTAEQRTKEIGVRKVMGASIQDIIKLLTKTYIILIIIANLIAWPIGYFAMHKWLQNFAYRINIGIGIFLLTGLIALIIVIIAVSSQAIKASLTDPVESLRYE